MSLSSIAPGKTGTLALLLVAGCAVATFLMGAHTLYEWDSVNFALGAADFDLPADQPHAPGYPLWILLMRLAMLTGADANRAQILLAGGFTVLALAGLYALARSRYGARVALFAVTILCTSPLVALYGAVPLTYAVDLCAACALAWLAHRLARGDGRAAPLGLGLLALLAGIRPSGSLVLAPLVLVFALVGCRSRPRLLALSLAGAAAVGAAWLLPTLAEAGGWREYLALCRSQSADSFTLTSVLFGAGWGQQAKNLAKVLFFLGMGLGAPLAVQLGLLLARGGRAPQGEGARPSARLFYGLWLLPGLAFLVLVHAPKPGYVLVVLPGLALALAVGIERALGRAAGRIATGAVLVVVAVLNITLFLAPYDALLGGRFPAAAQALGRCGRASILQADRSLTRVLSAVEAAGIAPECCRIVTFGGRFGTDYRGPNWRKLAYYLPAYRVGYVDTESLEAGPDGVRTVTAFDLPDCAERIWWVVESPRVRQAVLEQFPGTREQYSEDGVALLFSSIPAGPYARELALPGCRLRWRRP